MYICTNLYVFSCLYLPDGGVCGLRRVEHFSAQPGVDVVPCEGRRLGPLLEP